MNYLPWAVLALVAYTFVAPLMSFATASEPAIPSNVAALVSNSMLVVATVGVIAYTRQDVSQYLVHPKSPYVYVAGLCLAVGILAYYRALSLGPASVVVPVFGMFLVTSSLVSVAFLDESFTVRKAVGILLAVVAVYLVTVD